MRPPSGGMRNATSVAHARSSQPFNMAGKPYHQVGYTNKTACAHLMFSIWGASAGSVGARSIAAALVGTEYRIEFFGVEVDQPDLVAAIG